MTKIKSMLGCPCSCKDFKLIKPKIFQCLGCGCTGEIKDFNKQLVLSRKLYKQDRGYRERFLKDDSKTFHKVKNKNGK